MKKLIISDIDGTLHINGSISQENKDFVKRVQDEGHLFTLATGRHINSTLPIIKELNINLPVVCSNGGIIYDFMNDKIIKSFHLDKEVVYQCIDICTKYNTNYYLYSEETIHGSKEAIEELLKHFAYVEIDEIKGKDLDNLINRGIIKVLITEFDASKLELVSKEINQIKNMKAVISGHGLINVGSPDASKAFDIKDELIKIGDEDNDISMITLANIGIAMRVGSDKLKELANDITTKDDETALARALSKYL